jgi:hypothetical protein
MTLTFMNGFNAGSTFTGAFNGDLIVLTNLSTIHGPRAVLVRVAQPTTASAMQACTDNPLMDRRPTH